MTILARQTIIDEMQRLRLRIEPHCLEKKQAHGLSYGLSACGYDVRLAHGMWLWPGAGRLGVIMEWLALPHDICARVLDKSTNARRFIFVQNTIIEPGWFGYLTVELTRCLPWPVYIRAGTPIAQIVFERLDQPTDRPYCGKYQDQPARPVPAKMEG